MANINEILKDTPAVLQVLDELHPLEDQILPSERATLAVQRVLLNIGSVIAYLGVMLVALQAVLHVLSSGWAMVLLFFASFPVIAGVQFLRGALYAALLRRLVRGIRARMVPTSASSLLPFAVSTTVRPLNEDGKDDEQVQQVEQVQRSA